MSYALSGVALVTGAGRGIGRAIAERLASMGMNVAVAARTQNEIEDVAQAIGGKPVVLDVTDRESVAQAVDIVEHELGAIDLLVNNAGIIETGGPAWEQDAAEWWRVFEVNVMGPFLLMQAVIPRMTETIAHDARPHGVHVFAMRPGSVLTSLVEKMLNDLGAAANDFPEDTWTSPETAGNIVAFMATGALDSLSGRHIDAGVGDWRSLPDRIDEIMADDLFTLRLRR